MLNLRPYQNDLLNRLRHELRSHQSVLLQLGTGAGKTVIGSVMAKGISERGKTLWFFVHRDFLIRQTVAALREAGIGAGVIASHQPTNPFANVQVVSIQTITRRLERYTPPDFFIIDEAHFSVAKSWHKVIKWLIDNGARGCGLTASPARLDGRGLGALYQTMIEGPTVATLMRDGYLSDYRAFAPSRPDLTKIAIQHGDYQKNQLENIMDDGQIISDAIGWYKRLAYGKRAIYFEAGVRVSQHTAAMFNGAGIPARHLDASATSAERQDAAQRLASGELRVLTNVDLFTCGYDLASQAGCDVTIEAVGLRRPTQSLVLFLQQVGRALRPKSEPAIILDHAGNLARHGLPDQEREWSLEGMDRKKKSEAGISVRQCPSCYAIHRPAPVCPYCGHAYVIEPRTPEEIAGDLAEVDREAVARAARWSRLQEQEAARTLPDLIRLGQARNYRFPRAWAENLMRARNGKMVRRMA